MKLYALKYILFSLIIFPGYLALDKFDEILHHLGTRTPYRFKSNKNESIIKYPGCKAKKIWMIVRHGTRLPGPKDIIAMNSTLNDIKIDILLQHKLDKGQLNKKELSNLRDWSSSLDVDNEKRLAPEGQEEMKLLAERMQKRFPELIKDRYNNDTFLFKYTPTERTQQSARYFANGLYGTKHAKDVTFTPATAKDIVLRFYKHCDKWQKQVKRNPNTYKELRHFVKSRQMNKTLEHVSKTLGLDYVLSFDEVKLMYKTCGYETAWNKNFPSPWCAAFNKETVEVMEYYFDMKHYWVDGYGKELTYRQACLSVKNMFEHLSHKNNPKSVFYFAHSGTLLKILSHLGLYRDKSHLTVKQLYLDRLWRTTDIDCFATNLAFVLFTCKDGDHILTLHQEHIVKLPPCDTELCPLEQLTQYYQHSIHNCDFTDMCSLDRSEL